MGKLIQRFPDAAKSVLDRCIQRSLAERSITYDFSLLDPGPDDKSGPNGKPFFGLNVIVEHKQKDLLVHDVCRKLLKIKWRVYGWFVYWTNLVFYFSFLALMTYFMLTQRGNVVLKRRNSYVDDDYEDIFDMEKDVFGHITEYLILIFAFIHLLKELYQIAVERTAYFKQVTNLLEWVLYLSTILFILPYVFPSLSNLRVNPNFTWQMGTVAVFLGYMNLILFVQTLDYVGIYVTMFYQVAITVIKAISIFLLFAVAFSVVFFILFREQVIIIYCEFFHCEGYLYTLNWGLSDPASKQKVAQGQGRSQDFSRGGGVTLSNIIVMAFSPRNIVGCFLKKRLTKGGSRAPQDLPLATPLLMVPAQCDANVLLSSLPPPPPPPPPTLPARHFCQTSP